MSDFTGDGQADALCVPSATRRSLVAGGAAGTFKVNCLTLTLLLFSEISFHILCVMYLFQAPTDDPNFPGFCKGTNDMIHVGDFDADGRKDLVCRKNKGERYQIALTGESTS